MKGHPILFSSKMIRAILDGRKTQTRRVIKPQPLPVSNGWDLTGAYSKMKYVPGDRMWVRETFRWADQLVDGYKRDAPYYIQYKSDGVIATITGLGNDKPGIVFEEYLSKDWSVRDDFGKWKPSIHMPRWASRITLEVVNVRVDRVNMISYADCIAEGIVDVPRSEKRVSLAGERPYEQYQALWDSLQRQRGYGWDVNPWVWVVEFKVIV
jgi:hypothetical protein